MDCSSALCVTTIAEHIHCAQHTTKMAETQASINYPVYIGIWTNWSRGGQIKGSTITLNHRDGALLTAFLAIFIAFAGSRLWRILCFILYQLSRPRLHLAHAQDGLHHQRQAILRNATDEKSGFLSLLYILLAWRRKASRPFTRMLPVIGLALFVSIALAIGSIFSSRISSDVGNEVLISSPECGINISNSSVNPTVEQALEIENAWSVERMTSYANYAQRCYSDSLADSAGRSGCSPYTKRRLSSMIDRNASCPFEESICRSQHGNIRIDTGYFGSQDIGLNLPTDLQFKIRKTLQCAPLQSKNYQKVSNYSQDKLYTQYYYGSVLGAADKRPRGRFTYEVEVKSSEEIAWRQLNSPDADYSTQWVLSRRKYA